MDASKQFSSFTCDIKIIEAKNIESKLKGNIFARCYIPSQFGDQKPIILNSQEISTKNDHVWNDSFSLDCRETEGSIGTIDKLIKQQSLVFELRLRNTVPLLGITFGGSKLLGRAEISLEKIINSPNTVFDKWLTMVLPRGHEMGKCPKLKVEIKANFLRDGIRKNVMRRDWEVCGCKNGQDHDHHGCTCDDYDVFALVVALETF